MIFLEKVVHRARRFPEVSSHELCLLLQCNGEEGGKGKGGAGTLWAWLLGVAYEGPQQP